MQASVGSEMKNVRSSNLRRIIEAAYDLFAPYTLSTSLDVCKACCVTDKDEQLLLTTPLRETSRNMLNNGYFCSARGHSRRENWEMKHFLPRVLELVSEFEIPCHSTEITFLRLDLDYPDYWKPAERELLDAYALAFFENCLRRYPLPDGNTLTDLIIMFGLSHFDLMPLLQAWISAGTKASATHFVDLLVYELRIMSNGDVTLDNPFSEALVNSQIAFWLSNPTVRAAWAEQLENALLHGQLPDEEATQASLAYEILAIGLDGLSAPPPLGSSIILS
jgi:hypothetical protein